MPTHSNAQNDSSDRANLQRLVVLRNIGILGTAVLIAASLLWLNIQIPLIPLATVLLLLSGWNLLTSWRMQKLAGNLDKEILLQLVVDLVAVSCLLYFTGGATNPFAWILLLPVIIAATVLPRRLVWTCAVLAIAAYSVLMINYQPLSPQVMDLHSGHEHAMHNSQKQDHQPAQASDHGMAGHSGEFSQHIFGMWFGFMFSAVMVAYFVAGMANTLRERDRILATAREQALRDERLVALGTLATGAAHELGTPLGTMAIVTDELAQEYPAGKDAELNERLLLIREQINRCKTALSVISASAGELRAEDGEALPVDSYLDQLAKQWGCGRPEVGFQYQLEGQQPPPTLVADRALSQALINILNNAADASPHWVHLHAHWTDSELMVEVRDRGPGLSEAASAAAGKMQFSTKEQGLGLGLYLAHSVIDRLGGVVTLFNRENGGVCTRIILPLGSVSA